MVSRFLGLQCCYFSAATEKSYLTVVVVQAIESAPADDQVALRALARVYGISKLLENATFYYAHGVFEMRMEDLLREQLICTMQELMVNGGQPALALCDGFGIPPHALQAPIAFDWRKI